MGSVLTIVPVAFALTRRTVHGRISVASSLIVSGPSSSSSSSTRTDTVLVVCPDQMVSTPPVLL